MGEFLALVLVPDQIVHADRIRREHRRQVTRPADDVNPA